MVPNERGTFQCLVRSYGNETCTIYRMCQKSRWVRMLICSSFRLVGPHASSNISSKKTFSATHLLRSNHQSGKNNLGISSMPSLQQVLLAGFSQSIEFNIMSWIPPLHKTPWQLWWWCIHNWTRQLNPTPKKMWILEASTFLSKT